MPDRDFTSIPAIRAEMTRAERSMAFAQEAASSAGLSDTAAEIGKVLKMSRVLTGQGGWLDHMAKGEAVE